MTEQKTETKETMYFQMPPCRNRLLAAARADDNHRMAEGPLFVVCRDYLNLEAARPAYFSQTGIRPRNTAPELYAAGAEIYPNSYNFRPGDLVCPELLAGIRQCASEESRAWIDSLIRSEAIHEVGIIAASGSGAWLNYCVTPEGVDKLFFVDSRIMAAVIRPIDPKTGYPASQLPVGRVYLSTGNLSLSGCSQNAAVAGSLIPEACLPGAASLVEQGRLVLAGGVTNLFSNVELLDPVQTYFRGLAIVECDERVSDAPRTEAQAKYLKDLFAQAVETGSRVPASKS